MLAVYNSWLDSCAWTVTSTNLQILQQHIPLTINSPIEIAFWIYLNNSRYSAFATLNLLLDQIAKKLGKVACRFRPFHQPRPVGQCYHGILHEALRLLLLSKKCVALLLPGTMNVHSAEWRHGNQIRQTIQDGPPSRLCKRTQPEWIVINTFLLAWHLVIASAGLAIHAEMIAKCQMQESSVNYHVSMPAPTPIRAHHGTAQAEKMAFVLA